MTGRSLWYAFMLTWLSATSTASPPEDPVSSISVTEQSAEGNLGAAIDSKDSGAFGELLASEDQTKTVAKSS